MQHVKRNYLNLEFGLVNHWREIKTKLYISSVLITFDDLFKLVNLRFEMCIVNLDNEDVHSDHFIKYVHTYHCRKFKCDPC